MAASRAGDLASLLDLVTDDVVFMAPNRSPFGKAEFAAESQAEGASFEGRAEIQEIEIFGPPRRHPEPHRCRAAHLGAYRGYAVSLLRKEADGRWRLAASAGWPFRS